MSKPRALYNLNITLSKNGNLKAALKLGRLVLHKNGNTATYWETQGYQYMTDDEIAVYNYYYKVKGKGKAEEYLASIQESLNYRTATKIFSNLEDDTLKELVFGVGAGLDQFASGVKNLFNTSDDYIPQTATQMTSGMVREDLEDTGFKIFGHSVGQIGYDLINTTSNMLPSILTSTAVSFINPTAGAAVGAGLMGASASGNAYQEMLNLGYDKGQARSYSVMVGASEATLQYLLGGINKLGGKLTKGAINKLVSGIDNAYAKLAINYGGKIASEFTEEALQEVLSPFFQNIATGININTIEDIDWAQVFYSGLLGALSAGGFEGKSTIREAKNIRYERKTTKSNGSNINTAEKTGALAQEDSLDIAAPLTNEQRSLLSTVSTETLNTALGENSENITLAKLGISDTAMQQSFVELGLADAEGNVNRQALTSEVKLRNDFTNIDGQTTTGYNNDTNINRDKGGIGDVTSDRLGENSEVENQRSEANTRSQEQRTRQEDQGTFRQRNSGSVSGRTVIPIKNTLFAYTPKDTDGSQASKAVEILNKAGINAVYCEGNTESNADGATTLHTEAVTTPDGTIYVSSNSSLSSIQIAAHEAVHYHQKNNTVEYAKYQSVTSDNVLWGTDEYLFIAKQIFNAHHRMQYEIKVGRDLTEDEVNYIITSPKYRKAFLVEFTAYVNEAISANSTETIEMFSKVFSNWDAVVEASRKFNEAIGLDFSGMLTEIDGQTTTGYNNDTNTNQDKGGIDSGKESLDNRGHSQGDRQRSQTNAEAESEERRIRPENEEDFVRRVAGASQKSPRKIRRLGNTLFAYTPSKADGSEASRAVGYLKRAGIDAIYCEGSTESNKNGNTTEHNQATTSTDGKTFVSSNATLSAVQIAAHEAVHVKMYENAVEYTEFESVICDGLLWGTDEYAAVAKEIFEGYHRSKYEKENGHTLTDEEVDDIIRSPEYAPDFLIEFTAYVNEAISANSTETIEMFSKVFSNWDAVVEASRRFNEAVGLDFSSADTATESSPIDSQSTDTDSESAPTGGRVLDMPAITVKQQNFVKKIGKALGRKVEFVNMEKFLKEHDVDTEKLKIYPDGAIDSEGNIFIWYNAEKPVQFLFKHELTHFGERSKYYKRFVEFVRGSKTYEKWMREKVKTSESYKEWLKRNPQEVGKELRITQVEGFLKQDHINAQSKLKENFGKDDALAEVIADFVGENCFGESLKGLEALIDEANLKQHTKAIQYLIDCFAYLKKKLSGNKQITFELSRIEDSFRRLISDANKTKTSDTKDGVLRYSFSAEKQESDTPQTLHAVVNEGNNSNANVQLSNNKVTQDVPVVKNNSMQESENYSSEKNGLKFSVPTATENETDEDTQSTDFTHETVEKYTESQYNNFGWVRANDVLSATAYNLFKKKVAEIRTGVKFPKSRYGEYIIAVGNESGIYNILVYTDGDMNEPYIRKVVEIRAKNPYIADLIRSEIYDADNGKLWDAVQYVKDIFGEENIREYKGRDFPSFRQYFRGKEGNAGIQNGKNDEGQQNRGRADKSGGTIPLKFSIATDERNDASTDFTAEFKELMQSFQNGEISQDEYRQRMSELYQRSIEENGQIKPGEKVSTENKDFPIPKSVKDGTKVRQHVSRILESGRATEEQESFFKEMILAGDLSYTPTSNEKNIKNAEKAIEKEGYQKAKENWKVSVASKAADANMVAKGEALLQLAFEQKNAVDIVNLAAQLAELGTYIGQGLQAMSLVKHMGGLGQLVYLERCVARINESLKNKIEKGKAETVTIDPTLAQQLAESKTEAEFEITYAAIVKDIAAQVPPTFADKWNTMRYVCMLLNPVSHIRNMAGNGGFFPAVRIKNVLAAVMEKSVSKNERTKVVKVKKAYQEYAENDFNEVKDIITGTGKYNPSDEIRSNQRIFKSKLLEAARKFNFDMLEKEDVLFLKKHYKHALGGYLQAQGIDLREVTPSQLAKAREYAMQEALKATYRDASKLANWLSQDTEPSPVSPEPSPVF